MSTRSVRSRLHIRSELPCAALMLMFAAAADAQSQQLGGLPDLIEAVAPSVVTVQGIGEKKAGDGKGEAAKDKDGKEPKKKPQGSGIVLSSDGYIVTVGHLLKDVHDVTVTFEDSTVLPAKLVGTDENTDVGLLKVEPLKPLQVARFADSDKVRRGEPVIAIGNPFGLGGSVTLGIISATHRNIGGNYDYLQTDADMNHGNAGGPLFDFNRNVVGMESAIYSPTGHNIGIGFAIPSNLVQKVAGELKQSGSIQRGWLGVRLQKIDPDTVASLGLQSAKGALLTEIMKDGPAALAGLKAGDVVLEINGNEVADSRDLARMVADQKAYATAQFVIWRDHKKKTVPVLLGRFPSNSPAPAGNAGSPQDARFPGLKVATSDKGELVITAVDAGSDAEAKGLKKGDIVLEAGGMATKAPKDLTEAIAKSGARGAILLRIKSGDAITYRSIRLGGAPSGPSAAPSADDFKDLDRLE